MSRTLNQIIKDTAFENSVDYKPWEDGLSPQKYYQCAFAQGAEWMAQAHKHHQIRMWEVKVFDDHKTIGTRMYTVPATSGRDAQLMAFILDRGIGDDRYGHGGTVELGELELAQMHTEIISSNGC